MTVSSLSLPPALPPSPSTSHPHIPSRLRVVMPPKPFVCHPPSQRFCRNWDDFRQLHPHAWGRHARALQGVCVRRITRYEGPLRQALLDWDTHCAQLQQAKAEGSISRGQTDSCTTNDNDHDTGATALRQSITGRITESTPIAAMPAPPPANRGAAFNHYSGSRTSKSPKRARSITGDVPTSGSGGCKHSQHAAAATGPPDLDSGAEDAAPANKRQRGEEQSESATAAAETGLAGWVAPSWAAIVQAAGMNAAAAAAVLGAAISPPLCADAGTAAAVAAAVPLADEPECPICMHTYECDESEDNSESRVPRSLPCAHSLCSHCLLQLLAATPGSVTALLARADNRSQADEINHDGLRLLTLPFLMLVSVAHCPRVWVCMQSRGLSSLPRRARGAAAYGHGGCRPFESGRVAATGAAERRHHSIDPPPPTAGGAASESPVSVAAVAGSSNRSAAESICATTAAVPVHVSVLRRHCRPLMRRVRQRNVPVHDSNGRHLRPFKLKSSIHPRAPSAVAGLPGKEPQRFIAHFSRAALSLSLALVLELELDPIKSHMKIKFNPKSASMSLFNFNLFSCLDLNSKC